MFGLVGPSPSQRDDENRSDYHLEPNDWLRPWQQEEQQQLHSAKLIISIYQYPNFAVLPRRAHSRLDFSMLGAGGACVNRVDACMSLGVDTSSREEAT